MSLIKVHSALSTLILSSAFLCPQKSGNQLYSLLSLSKRTPFDRTMVSASVSIPVDVGDWLITGLVSEARSKLIRRLNPSTLFDINSMWPYLHSRFDAYGIAECGYESVK